MFLAGGIILKRDVLRLKDLDVNEILDPDMTSQKTAPFIEKGALKDTVQR